MIPPNANCAKLQLRFDSSVNPIFPQTSYLAAILLIPELDSIDLSFAEFGKFRHSSVPRLLALLGRLKT